jgi:tripartite-type tricarboxylate transporter receptor subunit TctC
MPGTMQHVQTGRLRVLGVNSEKRSALLPDVPTVAEAGVRGFEASTWFGLLAPAGTPREVIVRLNAATARVLTTADVNERFGSEGAVAAGGAPDRFAALIKAEIEKWGKVVRASGVRVD